jgi:miniconductance mechanosensitive channel
MAHGVPESAAPWASTGILAVAILILAWLAQLIARRVVLRVVKRLVAQSKTDWDDAFLDARVFHRLSHLAPALLIYATAPIAFGHQSELESAVRALALVYMTLMTLAAFSGALNASLAIYERYPIAEKMPLKGFMQLLKVLVFLAGGIFVLSHLLGRSPLVFFGGLGAFTAVILLIFKDAILGLVAGVQISTNDLVRIGDWIEMPKFGADGDVVDISLTTVKVQNWDKTISTIPAYALVSESVKNWRGMSESGGRRIKRALSIDMRSVRFCDAAMLERFGRFQLLRDHIAKKTTEIAEYNRRFEVDESELVNGRRMTNLGSFRAYVESYLRAHPQIHDEMTFLVRQLAPGATGIPIEIYVFSRDQRWVEYEGILADIFDHLLAVVPLFELRVFQQPSGADLETLAGRLTA